MLRFAILTLTALCTLSTTAIRASTLALDFTVPLGFAATSLNTQNSAGWAFTTNQEIMITALDSADVGVGFADFVRIYDASGKILTLGHVTSLDPLEGTGAGIQFYTQTITPIVLAANTTYYINQDNQDLGGFYDASQVQNLTVNPLITYDGPELAIGSGRTPTSATSPIGGDFGPNFDAVAVTPEPSGTALLVVALGTIGLYTCIRRRRRSKVSMVALPI